MWGTGNGEVTFTHDVALAFLCYEMSPSEPLFSHLQNVNGLPAPQDPLGISWADARRVLGTEEVTKCCSLISPPPCPPAFSLRTFPLLSGLGLTLSNWSIQTTLTQSSQLQFKTPPLFLSITSILILELMSIDGDVCAHLWPQNGCMCWLPLVSSSVEDRKQISCLKVVLCTWNSL